MGIINTTNHKYHDYTDSLNKELLGNQIVDQWLRTNGIEFREATIDEQWKGIDRVITSSKTGGHQ